MAAIESDGNTIQHAEGVFELLDSIVAYVTGKRFVGVPVANPANTGTGAVSAPRITEDISDVDEVITLVCTAASVDGGTFSVDSDVAGALGSLTVGTPFDYTGVMEINIADGAVDFIVGDTFTIQITGNSAVAASETQWSIYSDSGIEPLTDDDSSPGGASDTRRVVYLYVPGDGEHLYPLYLRAYKIEPLGVQNIEIRASGPAAEDIEMSFVLSRSHFMLGWSRTMPWKIQLEDDSFRVIAKVSQFYETLYAGKYVPLDTAVVEPNPYAVGGSWSPTYDGPYDPSSWDIAPRYGWYRDAYRSDVHSAFFRPTGTLSVLTGGEWQNCYVSLITDDLPASESAYGPYEGGPTLIGNTGPYIEDQLRPLIILSTAGVIGQLIGVYGCCKADVAPEDVAAFEGSDYIFIPNICRSEPSEFAAYKMG